MCVGYFLFFSRYLQQIQCITNTNNHLSLVCSHQRCSARHVWAGLWCTNIWQKTKHPVWVMRVNKTFSPKKHQTGWENIQWKMFLLRSGSSVAHETRVLYLSIFILWLFFPKFSRRNKNNTSKFKSKRLEKYFIEKNVKMYFLLYPKCIYLTQIHWSVRTDVFNCS